MTSGDVWGRLLFMILFAVIFSVARAVLGFVVVFQFFWILFAGAANEPLLRFGKNLTVYVNELLEFQTFNAETKPFPFSPWPDEEPGGEIWLDDELDDDLDDYEELDAGPEDDVASTDDEARHDDSGDDAEEDPKEK